MENNIVLPKKITRSYIAEMRADITEGENKKGVIIGTPAVYGQKTQIGELFEEVIENGAFSTCDFDDVPLFINHNPNDIPLARSRRNTKNSSLQLTATQSGLEIRTELDIEKNPQAAALYSAIERGDIKGMSFRFRVADEWWENLDTNMPIRHITKIAKVFEVSAVNYPAYDGTEIYARDCGLLENDIKALDNARAMALDNTIKSEVELLKARIKIIGG